MTRLTAVIISASQGIRVSDQVPAMKMGTFYTQTDTAIQTQQQPF